MPSSTTSLASYFACVGLFAFSTAQADFPVTTPEPTSPPLSTPSNPVIGYPATVTPSVTTSPIAPPAPTPVPAQVIRAAFTTGLVAREPVNQLTRVNAGQTLYYFTELGGLQEHVITHRWEYNGKFQLGMQFPVGGERWRVQSSKSITPNMVGTWTVTVINDNGQVLRQDTLQVDPVAAPVPAPVPLTPPPQPIVPLIPIAVPNHNTPVIPANPPSLPNIPAPAAPLTKIPAELEKAPAQRTESDPKAAAEKHTDTPPETKTAPKSEAKPIWDSLRP